MSETAGILSDRSEGHACPQCADVMDRLNSRISELMEENSNLRLLQDSVRRNRVIFESLIAHSSVGIALTSPDRRILKIVRGLTGLNPTGQIGNLVELFAVPEDQAIIIDCYKLLLGRVCQQVKRDIRVNRADGAVRWFSITLTDMLDNPDVQAIVWNYHDITAQKGFGLLSS